MRIQRLALLAFLVVACSHATVAVPPNEYGLEIVSDVETYREIVRRNPPHALVDLEDAIPGARFDVRYAGTNNFMNRRLYEDARVFLRRPAADALAAVQRELETKGLGILVFDGYRPYAVTKMMWDEIGDPDYVADPAHGSRHNRGAAVDLTLVELDTGEPLAMPTGYDSFEPAAHHGYMQLSPEMIENRQLLLDVMTKHGFEPLSTEWWHYDFSEWQEFHLMDIPFAELDLDVSR